jgi:hypothetical protein
VALGDTQGKALPDQTLGGQNKAIYTGVAISRSHANYQPGGANMAILLVKIRIQYVLCQQQLCV